jgi:GNAT superfamily N-acetyltransferase
MEFLFLAERPDALATVAKWYFDEWGYLGAGSSAEDVAEKIRSYLNADKIPLIVMAVEHDEVLGVVQLKYREMEIYPDKEHWLGGVYVPPEHRGKKIAAKLITRAIGVARSLGVKTLYLQTENLDGGLYRKLGWQPIERVKNRGLEVLVMEKKIA